MTTKEVHKAVRDIFSNYEHKLFNSFLFDWESDFFAISKSGYAIEVEVKVSKADFKKDFTHKRIKHKILSEYQKDLICVPTKMGAIHEWVKNQTTQKMERFEVGSYIDFVKPYEKLPNQFYYACPEGVIKPNEVPGYAGLIYTQNTDFSRPQYWFVKKAPYLHRKVNKFYRQLMQKYFFRNLEAYNMLIDFKRKNILPETHIELIDNIIRRLC